MILPRIAGISLLALLAFVAHSTGRRMGTAGLLGGGTTRNSSPAIVTPAEHSPEPRKNAAVDAARLERVKSHLNRLNQTGSYLARDWEAIAEIDTLLENLSATELSSLYREFSSGKEYGDIFIATKVATWWAMLDPAAALLAANEASSGPMNKAVSVFYNWAMDRPAVAVAWMNSGDFPQELEGLKDRFRTALVANLAERDLALASSELLKMGAGERSKILGNWGLLYSSDPSTREKLVESTKASGNPGDYAALNSGLLKTWPQDDAMGMLDYLLGLKGYLESGAISSSASPGVDASAVAAAIRREYHRPALEWWMERYSTSKVTPPELGEAMIYWINKDGATANQWLAEQPESLQKDALYAATTPSLIEKGNFEAAAANLALIRDLELHEQIRTRLDLLWTAQNPEAAKAWKAGLGE